MKRKYNESNNYNKKLNNGIDGRAPLVAQSNNNLNYNFSYDSKLSCCFNDPIHGMIHMDGLCLRIIDTKQYQRLRDLKQLGTCFYVFPGTIHTRFEHSIGVAHYAETIARTLRDNQPHLNITEADILCVKLAGLCHDLGHGPFSHLYDGIFMARLRPTRKWRHEDGSVQMMNYLLKQNNIELCDYGLSEKDKLFIEEIISGTPESRRKGRDNKKFYLYDIVNNSRSGLDVDKLDYFQRDMKYSDAVAGNINSFHRIIQFGRVFEADPIINPITRKPSIARLSIPYLQSSCIDFNGEDSNSNHISNDNNNDDMISNKHYMICYPEKMIREIVDVFAVRFRLHLNVCTHKSVKKIDYMITDIMEKADPYIKIPGTITKDHPDGYYKISECVDDCYALSNLNDNIIYLIENSKDIDLKPSQEILKRIHTRNFYSSMGKFIYYPGEKPDLLTITEITAELISISNNIIKRKINKLKPDNVINTTEYEGVASSGSWDSNCDDSDGLSIQSQDSAIGSPLASPIAFLKNHNKQQYTNYSENDNNELMRTSTQHGTTPFTDTIDNDNNLKRTKTWPESTNSYNNTELKELQPLLPEDIIVEKINIHHGMKQYNPLTNIRFFPKDAPISYRAHPANERSYETSLPRCFQELAIRLFCRNPEKDKIAREAFEIFCKKT